MSNEPNPNSPVTGDPRVGIRIASPLISIVASATATAVYSATTGRSHVIRKVHGYNRTGGQRILTIGDGLAAAFVARLPLVSVPNNSEVLIGEDNLCRWEFPAGTNITAQVDVSAAAPNEFQLQIEVEAFAG